MNPNLIDHLLSSYGLIEGKCGEIAEEFVSKNFENNTKFQISKVTEDFTEMVKFLSKPQDNPNRHALFQHTPGWTLMLSNSKELDCFDNYQKYISEVLNRKSIRIVDVKNGKNPFTHKDQIDKHIFHMIDADSKVQRSVKSVKTNDIWEFSDQGNEFKNINCKNKKAQPKFDSNDLTELIKAATKYDQTLDEKFERKFVLIREE